MLLPCYAYSQNSGVFIDKRDNTSYQWVKIGTQIWMAEDLRFELTKRKDSYTWYEAMDAKRKRILEYNPYAEYELKQRKSNPTEVVKIYKFSYRIRRNWNDSVERNKFANPSMLPSNYQGLCPNGWHVPSPKELKELITYIDDIGLEGKHLKTKEDKSFTYRRNKGSLDVVLTAKGLDTYGFNGSFGSVYYTTKSFNGKVLTFTIHKYSSDLYINFDPVHSTYKEGKLRCIKN